MKRIIFSMLMASAAAFAIDVNSVPDSVYKSGMLLPARGDLIYQRKCSSCHGADGMQTSFKGSAKGIIYSPIAGWSVDKLYNELLSYKSGRADKDYTPVNKTGYGAVMKSKNATRDLSTVEIRSIAEYINGLK